MPVAALLGEADSNLSAVYPGRRFINPENLILLGIRSYEDQKYALLKRLNVEIVYARQTGKLAQTLAFIVDKLATGCDSIGISIDLDLVDPYDAPGVETPVTGGISGDDLIAAIAQINRHPKVCALEICEFNPNTDQGDKTLHLFENIIHSYYDDSSANKFFGSSNSGNKAASVPN